MKKPFVTDKLTEDIQIVNTLTADIVNRKCINASCRILQGTPPSPCLRSILTRAPATQAGPGPRTPCWTPWASSAQARQPAPASRQSSSLAAPRPRPSTPSWTPEVSITREKDLDPILCKVPCSLPRPNFKEHEFIYDVSISVDTPITMDLSQLVSHHNIPAQFELSLSPKCEPLAAQTQTNR